jgi:hypothetical protein
MRNNGRTYQTSAQSPPIAAPSPGPPREIRRRLASLENDEKSTRGGLKTSRITARSGEAIADKDCTAEAAGTAGVGVGNSLVPM